MERHPITAIVLSCSTCGLIRMADDYGSAHARGEAHIRLSGHPKIKYSQIETPERVKSARLEVQASMEMMPAQAGVKDIAVGSRYRT